MSRFLKQHEAELSPAVHTLAQELSGAGHRVTQPRLSVLTAASAHNGSFTAPDIEQWLESRDQSPGPASIFRTLKLLTEIGMLQRIHGVDECHRYSLSSGHAHRVVCVSCGKLAQFEDCALSELVERLQHATDYTITSHLLEFFGHCPACRAAANS
ncbi:MAG TPA: Fur family transcriptional regulator [Roseiflexaceae bacterium]|nr:Fur family transcriptional regulator [Roseiflexaceae bacterium]